MIIAIWSIGIMLMWMLNMLMFNIKGYWTINTYIAWCVVWTVAVVGAYCLMGGAI